MTSGQLGFLDAPPRRTGALRVYGGIDPFNPVDVAFTDLWATNGPNGRAGLPAVGQNLTAPATWPYELRSGDVTMSPAGGGSGIAAVTADGLDLNPAGVETHLRQQGTEFVADNAVTWELALLLKWTARATLYSYCYTDEGEANGLYADIGYVAQDFYYYDAAGTPDAIGFAADPTKWHLWVIRQTAATSTLFVDGVSAGSMTGNSGLKCWPQVIPSEDAAMVCKVRLIGAATGTGITSDAKYGQLVAWVNSLNG